MEGIVAMLTDEQQPVIWPIGIRGMSTHRARFAGVVCLYLNGHRSVQDRFIGQHALQFSKRPFRVGGIGLALRYARLLAMLAAGSFANVCQVFQTNDALGVRIHDAFGNDMIGVLLQPSLPSTDIDESPRCGTGAFLLQPLSQSCVMVRFGHHTFASVEGTLSLGGRGHSQIAYTYVYTHDGGVRFWCGFCSLNLKGDEQIELLVRLVIPELSCPDMSTILDKRHVFAIARIGKDHTPIQG